MFAWCLDYDRTVEGNCRLTEGNAVEYGEAMNHHVCHAAAESGLNKEGTEMEREPETVMREKMPELSTPRLSIRRFGSEEWPLLLAYMQDDGIADAFPEGIYTEQRLREMTEDPELYAIVAIEDERLLGHAALRLGVQPSGAALALGIASSNRREGYGEEAARLLLRHAFAHLGLHRITVSCPPENLALRALLEKLGMRMEAFFRRSVLTLDGEWRDECIYALLADEWRIQERLIGLYEEDADVRAAEVKNRLSEPGQSDRTEESLALAETWLEGETEPLDSDGDLLGRGALDDLAALALAHTAAAEDEEQEQVVSTQPEQPEQLIGEIADVSAEVEVLPIPDPQVVSLPDQEAAEAVQSSIIEAAEPVEVPAEIPVVEGIVQYKPPVAESSIPQVTLDLGEEGGGRPFVPILPASLSLQTQQRESSLASEVLDGQIEQRIDGVPFVLRRPHDLNWLAPFGRVFRVWDRQDSGNLGFGLEIEGQKVFIKYAGAFTVDYDGHPVDAIRRLREAAAVYEVLQHPALVRVLDHFETADGYAVLYEWAEGKLLRPGAEEGAADAVISRFRRLPVEERVEAMDTILEFHAYVEAMNYVAIDFYDGSLIYDFEKRRMTLCDIDFYRPKPYTNDMGRMWGSSRFMSPEEYEWGAPIDSRTNVYNLGAMAFHLLGGGQDHSRELWEAGNERYQIALRAVSPERADRWESVDALLEAWGTAQD
ncbi:hypothetical protein B9G55_14495 [Saccharibacillus sp. O16]|nr:hypothetical protein B9G55_14495 [Saccharibacillus sp. O16]